MSVARPGISKQTSDDQILRLEKSSAFDFPK